MVGGVVVRNATLHNEQMVHEKGVYPGARVTIQRAGDVIPEVVSVKDPKPEGWHMPDRCPVCGGEVVREEPYIAHRCINPFCPAQRLERVRHFVSRGAMDIEGLGPSTLSQLMERGLVEDPSDIYRLTLEQVLELDRFGQKSAENLIARIERSKAPTLGRFIYALGIPQVGEATALQLARDFGTLERLRNAGEEELQAVEGVGPSMATEIRKFFDGPGGELVDRLLAVGVRPQEEHRLIVTDGPLAGKTVVFTGSLERMSRTEAEELVRSLGGKPTGTVTAKTDIVVAGPGAGTKLEKAQKLKRTVMDENAFLEMVGR
jgi:DNA ligase (NAD+)